MSENNGKRYVRLAELCERLGKSERTIYRWVQRGDIPGPFKGLWDWEAIETTIRTGQERTLQN